MIATAGDRRDRDIRELGRVAAGYFDRIVIREDQNPRGRQRARRRIFREGVEAAVRDGARCRKIEIVLDELDATGTRSTRAKGDLVVLCVDHANRAGRSSNTGSTGRSRTCRRPATNGAGSSADIDAEDFF